MDSLTSKGTKAVVLRATIVLCLLAAAVLSLSGCGGASASLRDPLSPIQLTDGWQLHHDPGNIGLARGWAGSAPNGPGWSSVRVPSVFNPRVERQGDRGTVVWYETTFTGPTAAPGRSWAVAFESVRRHARVWLNGVRLGSNYDPFAPFTLPARSLRPGAENRLVVRVDNIKGPGSLPEDWWNWGGITGPVTLTPIGRIDAEDLTVTTQLGCGLGCGSLLVRGTLVNQTDHALAPALSLAVSAPGGPPPTALSQPLPVLAAHASRPVSLTIPLFGAPVLWSPAQPSLYGVQVGVSVDGRTEQQITQRVGFRSVAVHGGILYLNNHRLWLHGAAIHEDMAGHGAALSDGDIRTIVSELRAVGANVTRTHYLLSPRLLDALDAAGIMVWAQPPVDHADAVLATPRGRARAVGLVVSTVLGDRSHPSVIIDSVANELTPTPDASPGVRTYLQAAVAFTRALSPDVPVALDTYCYPGFPAQRAYADLDVLGISSYFGWYLGRPGHPIASFAGLRPFLLLTHARYPGLAVVVSEYGAEGVFAGSPSVRGSFAFQSDYLRRTLAVLAGLPFMNGSILWTLREFAVAPGWRGGADLPPGVNPTGIHHKGLIAYDGVPKAAFSVAAALLPQVPGFAR